MLSNIFQRILRTPKDESDADVYPYLFAPSEGYIFVITYGRSGSTLLQRILNSFPGYCIRGENDNMFYHLAKVIYFAQNSHNFIFRRGANASERESLGVGQSTDPWYGAELVDPRSLGLSLCEVFARNILNAPKGTRVSGFKEIRFYEDLGFFQSHLDILSQFFPNTRFIFLSRDWVEVSRSGWWQKWDPEEVHRIVRDSDAAFHKYASANSNCFLMDYRKLSEDIDGIMALSDFLGESFDPKSAREILSERLSHLK